MSLLNRAVALLARREHTRQELAIKLGKFTESATEINAVLDTLITRGLLSDERFAYAYIHSHAPRFGRARLQQELRRRGVAADLAEAQMAAWESSTQHDEAARARAVRARKFPAAPADAKEWAKQARFLQARGFSTAVIRQVLNSVGNDDDSF